MNTVKFKKSLLFIFIFSCIASTVFAQNTNYRAQGNYYSAKDNFQQGNYSRSIEYIKKCKEALGGTNQEAQYLHIMAAYKLNKYEEAAREMNTFFQISERKVTPVYFDNSVERLTTDEVKDLTKLIDPIYESVEKRKANPCKGCSGTGKICSSCKGEGKVKKTCESCNGVYKKECKATVDVDGKTHRCTYGQFSYTKYHWNGGRSVYKYKCKVCDGEGYVRCDKCDSGKKWVTCPSACEKSGGSNKNYSKAACSSCNGRGF